MKVFFLFSLLCLCLNALAWSERGNGGNSIICDDPSQNKFYDAYEAEFRYGLKPVFPDTRRKCAGGLSCVNLSMRIARVFIDRLPDDADHLKKFMNSRVRRFRDDANFLDNINLLPIEDMGTAFVPKNCNLHQTVVQKPPRFPGDYRYIISNDQWKDLSPNHQAVGIIHELLYLYAGHMKQKIEDSEGIRYFNALIISDEISKLSTKQYAYIYRTVFSGNNE